MRGIGKAALNEWKHPYVVELEAAYDGLDIKLVGRSCCFTSRDTFSHNTDVQLLANAGSFVGGVSANCRSPTTLSNSLVEGSVRLASRDSSLPDHARRIAVSVAKLPDSFGEVVNANPGACREPHVMSQNDSAASANASKS